jgi:hypothetical protein
MEQFQLLFFNFPGSVHDSQFAEFGRIYDKFEEVYQARGVKSYIDSAFGSMTRDFLIKILPRCLWIVCTNLPGENVGSSEG